MALRALTAAVSLAVRSGRRAGRRPSGAPRPLTGTKEGARDGVSCDDGPVRPREAAMPMRGLWPVALAIRRLPPRLRAPAAAPAHRFPGFFSGLLHGFLVLFSLVASLFTDVRIYAFPNSGFWLRRGLLRRRERVPRGRRALRSPAPGPLNPGSPGRSGPRRPPQLAAGWSGPRRDMGSGMEASYLHHVHLHDEEWMYVLSGRGAAAVGNREEAIGPGDFLASPPATRRTTPGAPPARTWSTCTAATPGPARRSRWWTSRASGCARPSWGRGRPPPSRSAQRWRGAARARDQRAPLTGSPQRFW